MDPAKRVPGGHGIAGFHQLVETDCEIHAVRRFGTARTQLHAGSSEAGEVSERRELQRDLVADAARRRVRENPMADRWHRC